MPDYHVLCVMLPVSGLNDDGKLSGKVHASEGTKKIFLNIDESSVWSALVCERRPVGSEHTVIPGTMSIGTESYMAVVAHCLRHSRFIMSILRSELPPSLRE
jgi:hypothetical protein